MKSVLQLAELPVPSSYTAPEDLPILAAYQATDADAWVSIHGGEVRAVVTHSLKGFPSDLWIQLPKLELIANFGAGLDLIDLAQAARRGVRVTYTPDLLTHDVADLAITFMLALLRRVPAADSFVRRGDWGRQPFGLGRSTKGRRLGIIGMGRIGTAIALRGVAFAMEIGYHSRGPRSELPHRHFSTLDALAEWADILVAAVPGGPGTAGMIDRGVLDALGPHGVFINVSRGSVVDEKVLVEMLKTGAIGGAGLDVFVRQPTDGAAFAGLQNVILTPHIGSATVDTRCSMADSVYANVKALLQGVPLNNVASL